MYPAPSAVGHFFYYYFRRSERKFKLQKFLESELTSNVKSMWRSVCKTETNRWALMCERRLFVVVGQSVIRNSPVAQNLSVGQESKRKEEKERQNEEGGEGDECN